MRLKIAKSAFGDPLNIFERISHSLVGRFIFFYSVTHLFKFIFGDGEFFRICLLLEGLLIEDCCCREN